MYSVVLHVTNLCNFSCQECSQKARMRSYPSYHMSIEEMERFLIFTKQSGYTFKSLVLGGAEPLLWKNLKQALVLLNKNRDIFSEINIASNGRLINDDNIIELESIDKIYISRYSVNSEYIKKYLLKFPKITCWNVKYHYKRPVSILTDRIPGTCVCPKLIAFYNGKIYWCSAICSIIKYLDQKDDFYPDVVTELKKNYLKDFPTHQYGAHRLCGACVFNKNVQAVSVKIQT